MRTIAFLVEPHFLTRHWGVRVYLYSLARVLEHHGCRVDFVYPDRTNAGELHWYKLDVRDDALFPSAAPSSSGTPASVWRDLRDVAFRKEQKKEPKKEAPAHLPVKAGLRRPAVMPIGSTLAVERYDVALVSAPWIVTWHGRLPARTTMGLVFDLIPNVFGVILDDGKPFSFAHQHEMGFRYYEEHCDRVLTISEATRAAYLDMVRSRRPGSAGPDVIALPPVAPYHSLAEPAEACPPSRAARIVLAACFDLRKGLRELPEILNGLADTIDEVVIYGGVRCRQADAESFFNRLEISRVTWHLGPTARQVRDIFRQGQMLLFPSKFEGLGLPILEAQLEGCRVATYTVSPMQELALSGAVMLADAGSESIARLRHALQTPFNHAALQAEARATFVAPLLTESPLASFAGLDQASGSCADRPAVNAAPSRLKGRHTWISTNCVSA